MGEIFPKTLEPGHSAKVHVKWRTSHKTYRGKKKFTVFFREPSVEPVQLTLSAFVCLPVYFTNKRADFGLCPEGTTTHKRVVRLSTWKANTRG